MLPEQEWGTAHLPRLSRLQEEGTEPWGGLCALCWPGQHLPCGHCPCPSPRPEAPVPVVCASTPETKEIETERGRGEGDTGGPRSSLPGRHEQERLEGLGQKADVQRAMCVLSGPALAPPGPRGNTALLCPPSCLSPVLQGAGERGGL